MNPRRRRHNRNARRCRRLRELYEMVRHMPVCTQGHYVRAFGLDPRRLA